MSKEFRPVSIAGKGVIPDMSERYVVGGGKIETYKGLFNGKASGSQPINQTTQISIGEQSLVERGRRIGNVVVSTDGASVTYRRLKPASDFVAAVEAEKSKILDGERRIYAEQNAWYRSKAVSDLSESVVVLPTTISVSLDHVYSDLTGNWRGENCEGNAGPNSWVERGERFYSSATTVWKAPVRGLFLGHGSEFEEGSLKNLQEMYGLKSMSAVFFVPLKAEDRNFKLTDFNGLEKLMPTLRNYESGNKAAREGSHITGEDFRLEFAEAFKEFTTNDLPRVPLYEMPKYSHLSAAADKGLGEFPTIEDSTPT